MFLISVDRCRCAFNTAVQVIAVMPRIKDYLKQLSQSCGNALPLHTALRKQLEELAAAGSSRQVAFIKPFMEAMDSVDTLAAMSKRNPRYVSVQ